MNQAELQPQIPTAKIVVRWAHARQKFDEALKAMQDKSTISSIAANEERYQKRLEQSKPVLNS